MKENNSGLILSILYSIFAFTLFCVFMVLKLCGVIAWSWWVVTLPLWAFPALFIAFIALLLVIHGVYSIRHKDCAKCEYKLRCAECVYNGKDIAEIVKKARKDAEKEIFDILIKEFSTRKSCEDACEFVRVLATVR